jgi:hypothetical protein
LYTKIASYKEEIVPVLVYFISMIYSWSGQVEHRKMAGKRSVGNLQMVIDSEEGEKTHP